MRSHGVMVLIVGLFLGTSPATAATDAEPILVPGSYVVREGDTLEGITARILGSSERWRENWKLNPGLENPHLILPGTRLRILIPGRPPEEGAVVTRISRRVEEQPSPLPWTDSEEGSLLRFRDAVRTHEGASAEILLPRERLLLTEDSLVILGRKEQDAPTEASTDSIELVVGEVDLKAPPTEMPARGIEVTVGEARLAPRAGKSDDLWARTRHQDAGRSEVMLFTGEGEVAAAGASVQLDPGTGTTVSPGAAPTPPEALLPAPGPIEPAAGSSWPVARPIFRWEEVPGAASYRVEVCGDPECGRLQTLVDELTQSSWQAPDLPVADLYWRVTATAPSGLDGFPSIPVAFAVTGSGGDDAAPEVSLSFSGPVMGYGSRVVVGPGGSLRADVTDQGVGVDRWTVVLDGREVAEEEWTGGWSEGEHQVVVRAVDRAGNETTTEPRAFFVDLTPPEILWGTSRELPGGRNTATGDGDRTESTRAARHLSWEWSTDRREWRALGDRPKSIRSDAPGVWLRPTKGSVPWPQIGDEISRETPLWIGARDEGSGVAGLSFSLSPTTDGDVLVVEAQDNVGNESRWAVAIEAP